jgi:hypothetical protein
MGQIDATPTPSEFDAKLKDAISWKMCACSYLVYKNAAEVSGVTDQIAEAAAAIRAAVREIVPKLASSEWTTIDYLKGFEAATLRMLDALAAPHAPNERK